MRCMPFNFAPPPSHHGPVSVSEPPNPTVFHSMHATSSFRTDNTHTAGRRCTRQSGFSGGDSTATARRSMVLELTQAPSKSEREAEAGKVGGLDRRSLQRATSDETHSRQLLTVHELDSTKLINLCCWRRLLVPSCQESPPPMSNRNFGGGAGRSGRLSTQRSLAKTVTNFGPPTRHVTSKMTMCCLRHGKRRCPSLKPKSLNWYWSITWLADVSLGLPRQCRAVLYRDARPRQLFLGPQRGACAAALPFDDASQVLAFVDDGAHTSHSHIGRAFSVYGPGPWKQGAALVSPTVPRALAYA